MSRRPTKKLVTALACVASGAVGLGAYSYYKVKIFDIVKNFNIFIF